MNQSSRKPGYSLDGFVPNSAGRHVGMTPSVKLDRAVHGARMRRPGFHAQAPITPSATRTNIADFGRPVSSSSEPRRRPLINTPQNTRRNIDPLAAMQQKSEPGKPLSRRARRKAAHQAKKANAKHPRLKKVIKRGALVMGVFVALWAGWLGWKLYHDSSKVFGNGSNLLGFLSAQKLKGEDQGRVNILLAGDSADDPGHQGAQLTDSIMLLSIDTRHNKAFMMSIPRDLYVNLPDGMGYEKINAANTDTTFSKSGYPKGGMGALEYTVSQDFGIPIQYYSLINYTAFRDAVNAVGGVTLNIKSSNPYGLYDPNTKLKLPNGNVALNGQTALNLARSRGDGYGSYGFPGSDFDRTMYQREIGLAIKSKVFSTGVLANPIKLGQLFDAMGNNVKTDLSTGNVRRLYDIFKNINNNSIQSIGLNDVDGADLLKNYTTSNGQSALIPAAGVDDYSQIQLLLKKLTSSNPIVREGAKVVVLNGGNITGLAAKEKSVLTGKGINVVAVASAPATQTNDTIIDLSGGKMPSTKSALTSLFGSTVTTTNSTSYQDADFIVILGTSQAAPQQ